MILSFSFHGTTFAFQTKRGPFFQVVRPICWPRHGLVFRTTTFVGRVGKWRRTGGMECHRHFSFQGWIPWFPRACAWEHFGVGEVSGLAMVAVSEMVLLVSLVSMGWRPAGPNGEINSRIIF